jgi:hypothetical protein
MNDATGTAPRFDHPAPALPSPAFDRHPGPAPLRPPAHRAPLDGTAPPALTASAEVGAKGWPPTCRYATMLTNVKTISFFIT